MGTLASQGFQPSMRAILGFVFWRPGGIGVCVSGCVSALVSARVRWNAALECGRGHRRGLPALGVMAAASFVWCWVALRPTSGRGRTNRAPGEDLERRTQWASCSCRASFRRFSRFSQVSAGPALQPGRPRFRSGKFCDAEFSGRNGGGEGRE